MFHNFFSISEAQQWKNCSVYLSSCICGRPGCAFKYWPMPIFLNIFLHITPLQDKYFC